MIEYLLDTNVIIYMFGQHPTYLDFLKSMAGKTLGMSVITYMEALVGARNDEEERRMRDFLDDFEITSVNLGIGRAVAMWMRRRKLKSLRNPGLSDTIIGHTALALNVPLVTNDPKDFAVFSELKTIVIA